ncbi:VCBS repeat-containing protein [Aliifodinibius salicampi]|uniref:VCBS repeat-containing protein n=1 Tax=Fodinibius salicampi TaxID=1920655 RepID=A0ABT3PWI1_9BACT|nr:VCBS repeat-containing protein [Fodinibius salicampi]MCW9712211.1 VCBS repeat-containing protein [Fodinibius salicampi]
MSILLIFIGCHSADEESRFRSIGSSQSNITFANEVEQSLDFNMINYLYFYDGAGVSIGDINNDGLPDIYFTANMDSNKLYLNKGNFEFIDITDKARVGGTGDWTTGTTMADINGDGLLDIYVCNVHYRSKKGQNQLFINNGDFTFTERAAEYGLDFRGYSKQTVFFDMDRDGDLDMYLLNHAIHNENSFKPAEQRKGSSEKEGDRLYRNDGGKFTDITKEAGIYNSGMGYGLDVTVSDLNGNNYPDIYVSNDFHENDYLYLNQKDGTFKEVLEQSTSHTSRASMGNDIADINNDLKPDIAVVDMLPSTEEWHKKAVSSETYEVYAAQRDFGYHPQLIRNTLQLNVGSDSNSVPIYSDIAPMTGTHATDWSWSALLFDMDNDGRKDLFVSNGIYRRPNDKDYLSLIRSDGIQQSLEKGITEQNIVVIDSMPHLKIPNAAFRNEDSLAFSHQTENWGFNTPSYSSGAAYGDLDNDGDLDLVINNVNTEASIYQNMTVEQDSTNYLTVSIKGEGANTLGIGSKGIVYTGDNYQLAELFPTRGFQSSVDPRLFFGLGEVNKVDSLKIIWPDGKETIMENIAPNQQLTVDEGKVPKNQSSISTSVDRSSFLSEVPSPLEPSYRHLENDFNGFNAQPLMPYQLSQMGPPIAVGDVNSDGLDDLYMGGGAEQSGVLYIQQDDGKFLKKETKVFDNHALFEDTDAAFFDANNDGAIDLYVVSGGNEEQKNNEQLYDRLYINDGSGNFVHKSDALPDFKANGSVVLPLDYDEDGDRDLFVGSRSVPKSYGATPNSYLLENDGDGTYRDVTNDIGPQLGEAGMISDARSADITGNGRDDIIVAGDWMPIVIFQNNGGVFERFQDFESDVGLWQSLHLADIDGDGDLDILAGNMGLNTTLAASEQQPLVVYTDDFNGDGHTDPVIGQTKQDQILPIASRDHLLAPFNFLHSKFPRYESYAGKTLYEIFGEERLQKAEKKIVTNLASVYFENRENGEFKVHPFPRAIQAAPVFSFHAEDFDHDSFTDILAGGNFYSVLPLYGGQFDASYGWLLKGTAGKSFEALTPEESGILLRGEIREIKSVGIGNNDRLIVVGRNDQSPVFLE